MTLLVGLVLRCEFVVCFSMCWGLHCCVNVEALFVDD